MERPRNTTEESQPGHLELGRKNRRDTLIVMAVTLALVLLAVVLVRVLNPGYSKRPYARQEYVLDDLVTITAYGRNQAQVEGAVEDAFGELSRLDGIADRYDPESELSRLNAAAASGPVEVSEELWEMIDIGMQAYEASGGLFDITVGPLIDVWDVTGRSERGDPPPAQEEIEDALEKVGADKLVLDPAARTVAFAREGMAIDLGGVAKGYALDKAASALREGGVGTAIIDMISTSLTMGEKPGGEGGNDWRIAVMDPRGEGYLATLLLDGDTYISTSGDYQRFFEYGGIRYHHILDPRTGYPAQGAISVTVLGGRNGAWSDAMSTAAFIMGYPQGMEWLREMEQDGVMMVDGEGAVHVSPDLGEKVETIRERAGGE
ncbi:MAG: FAD:protein FMN transferase [Actinobacteria bacterium]|nr:FAD:protein FMN transferase [Actinomycetota bacterium]